MAGNLILSLGRIVGCPGYCEWQHGEDQKRDDGCMKWLVGDTVAIDEEPQTFEHTGQEHDLKSSAR